MFVFFFKQRTAYELLRSRVGSEMCRRDSSDVALLEYRYDVPFKFTGKIGQVTIELKEMKKADSEEAVQGRKAAVLKKGLSD